MPEALRGDLSHVRLSSLLQLVEAEGATGALSFPGSGVVRLSRGDIIEAAAGPLSGYAAVRTLFFVPSGPFVLDVIAQDPDGPRLPPLVPVTRAVLDGVRLLDEWARIGGMVLADYDSGTGCPKTTEALTFPAGTKIGAGMHLLVIADKAGAPNTPQTDCLGAGTCFHVGFGISGFEARKVFASSAPMART